MDGLRVGALRQEVEEGLVPCVILNAMMQIVRVNVGRPRRGKGPHYMVTRGVAIWRMRAD